jgi:hypothetical protein
MELIQMPDGANPALVAMQQNAAARKIVLDNSVLMVQQISSTSVNPANQNVLNIQPQNVGLTLGFMVIVSCAVTNGATTAANLTPLGISNLVQNFTYTDLQNINRIQTTGAHIALLNSAKQGFAFGGNYAPNIPIGIGGNNFGVFSGPATIAATVGANLRMNYFLPLAYSSNDLRGAVYTNVVNATQNLQITINKTPFVGATDPTNAVYSGNAAGVYNGNVTVTVYQVYRDQIPTSGNQPILPIGDLNTVYDLKNTALTGMVVGQDFPFAFPNMRQFNSVLAIYDNGGVLNPGTDINYWSLVSANATQIFKLDPLTATLFARQTFMGDPPLGTYYFDFRNKPIDTISFGNMTLNLNASTVGAASSLIVLTEAFQQVQAIPYASSLNI